MLWSGRYRSRTNLFGSARPSCSAPAFCLGNALSGVMLGDPGNDKLMVRHESL